MLVVNHKSDRKHNRGLSNPMSFFAEQGVCHMPPIQLSYGHHVQPSNQKPYPRCAKPRVQLIQPNHAVVIRYLVPTNQPVQENRHVHTESGLWRCGQIQLADSQKRNRDTGDQSSQRSSDSDVKNLLSIGRVALHRNYRSQRSNRINRKRQKDRRASGNLINQSRNKVSHLMGKQDQQNGKRID